MTNKEALITVSKSCKALAMEFGFGKISDKDKTALNTLKQLIVEHQQLKEENQKLKDKETPKKPLRIINLFYLSPYRCPVCKTIPHTGNQKYCDECGQKLDWSDE